MFCKKKCSSALTGVLIVMLLGLAACSSTPETPPAPEPAPAPEAQSYPGLAPKAPPKPLYEQQPILQNPQTSIWRPGYWSWTGSDFTWISGEVIGRPAPTAVWFPDHWMWHTYGWAFVPGYWE